jgi:hypothetical protein
MKKLKLFEEFFSSDYRVIVAADFAGTPFSFEEGKWIDLDYPVGVGMENRSTGQNAIHLCDTYLSPAKLTLKEASDLNREVREHLRTMTDRAVTYDTTVIDLHPEPRFVKTPGNRFTDVNVHYQDDLAELLNLNRLKDRTDEEIEVLKIVYPEISQTKRGHLARRKFDF